MRQPSSNPDSVRFGMRSLSAHARQATRLGSFWRYGAAFLLAVLVICSWTAFQLHSRKNEVFATRKSELIRTTSTRAILLTNWLTERREDVQSLSDRIWVEGLLSPTPSKTSAVIFPDTRVRLDQAARTYGYTGVAVLDKQGAFAAKSVGWNLRQAEVSAQVQQARQRCAPVLDVVDGPTRRWALVALSPVLPLGETNCSADSIHGYVAVEADAHATGLTHLHLTSPPNDLSFLFVARTHGVPLLTRFATDQRSGKLDDAAQQDADMMRLALPFGDGFHIASQGGREYWFATETVPLVRWTAIAYINRDAALADYYHARRMHILFDVLILLLIAGMLITWSLRVHARRLERELDIHKEIFGLREYARRIVEDSPVGLVVLDADWRIVSVNRSFRQMARIEESEPFHNSVDDWIQVDPVGPIQEWLSHQVREGVAKLRARNGRSRPVHVILSELTESTADGGRYLLTVEDLSQRKWMEERYRLLFEQNLAGIVQTNLSGAIIDCNESYARMLGYGSRLELLSRSVLPAYHHQEDRERILAELRRSGRVDGWEVELLRRDGSSVWTLLSASILSDSEGELPILQKTFVDITQRRLAQDVIEEQARLLDLTRDGVVVTDLQGNIRYWNQGAHLLYGWTNREARGQNLHSLLHSQFSSPLETIREELIRLGHWEGELRQVCRRGERVIVFSRWVLQRGSQSDQDQILVTNSDITQRKAAETALAESNRRILEIFNSIGEGFLALDQEWRFTYVNREAERLLRLPQDQLLGRVIWDVFPLFQTGPVYENCIKAMEQKTRVEFEDYSQTLGIWIEVHAYPTPAGLSLYFRDVSERRSLRIRLRQAEKMDAVGRLAGGIAHDFNNILNVIAGYGELLAQHLESDEKLGRYSREIVNASLRAGALTRQLLAFGRRQRMTPRVLNLNAVMESMQQLMQRLIGEDIELVTAQDPHLGNIRADSSQMEQVILNLAANARDAMPNGGKLLIETSNLDLDEVYEDDQVHLDPGRYVLLSVTDTGAGMEASVRERIFEPFFTTKEIGKGTGLGLATVDGVVQQSGGAIWVYSRPGLGTTFKIYLPRVEEKAEAAEGPSVDEEAIRGGNESVLLVEDEESLRAFVREVLEGYGYRVVTAGSGTEAVQRFHDAGPFQIAVTDVVMPGMGGAELIRQIVKESPEIKVLYMSGYTGRAMLRQGRLQPGARFLAKPFTAHHLARTVRECLDQTVTERVNTEI